MSWSKARIGIAAVTALGLAYGTAVALGAPPMMTANTGARLKVVTPKSGTILTGNTLKTQVSLTHFKVDCRYAGTADRRGIGHYHIELDNSLVNMFCGSRARVSMLD